MPKQAGPLADIILRRLRARGEAAYEFVDVITMLSRVQRLVNVIISRVCDSTQLTTNAYKLVYSLRSELPSAADIISIKSSNRTLTPLPNWHQLSHYDLDWFRRTGTRFESWTQIGRDLLVLYPALTTQSAVTVYYTKLTDELTTRTTPVNLPDEDIELLLGLTELLYLIDRRDFTRVESKRERIEQMLQLHRAAFPLERQ